MFKHTLLCGMVLGMMGVAALANAATKDKKTPPDSTTSTESNASTNVPDNQSRSLIMKAILVLHGGNVLQSNQLTGGDSSNPECSKCHG